MSGQKSEEYAETVKKANAVDIHKINKIRNNTNCTLTNQKKEGIKK
ncbi:hypothetical protein [Bacillus sp. V2I10]|nr:hypothetical protein [Bacillus sp. V2I10]